MKKIVILIIIAVALYQFGAFDFIFAKKGAFNEDGSPKIMLFVHGDCGFPCDDAQNYITRKNIIAEVIDIKNNEQSQKILKQHAKEDRLPVLIVGNDRHYGFHDKKYNELLYKIAGEKILTRAEKAIFKHHFYEDGTPMVVMYGVDWCGYCAKARRNFDKLGIAYTEWDVEKDRVANQRYKKLKASGYPLIYVGIHRIGSFNEDKIFKALEAYKS